MKKFAKGLFFTVFGLFGLIAVLASCSEDDVKSTDKAVSGTVQEPVKETKKEITPEEAKETAHKLIAEQEEKDYGTKMSQYSTQIGSSLKTIGTLSSQAGSNPTVILTDDWKISYAAALQELQVGIDGMRSVPAPDKFKGSNATIQKGLNEFQFVVDNMPKAIDNMDADLITECSTHMQNGSQYIKDATDQLVAENGK